MTTDLDGCFYRFSVKCDRAFNARLERAAKAAGLSVTSFVQFHFERILDPSTVRQAHGSGRADEAGFRFDARADSALARRHRIDQRSARALRWMAAHRDADGLVRLSLRAICEGAGVMVHDPSTVIGPLKAAGLIELARKQGGMRPGSWRVLAEVG